MNEDLMINKLISLEEKVDNLEKHMVKLDDLNNVTKTLDEIKGMLTKKDDEQTAIKHGLQRHEKRLERLEDVHHFDHTVPEKHLA